MAIYLGSKKIETIYDIVSPIDKLESFFDTTLTSLDEEDLNGLTSVKDRGFYNLSSLTKVVFPATLKSIGNNAFSGCSKVSYVRFLSENPPALGTSSLPSGGNFRTIYVPSGCLETYQNADGWSSYASKLREW